LEEDTTMNITEAYETYLATAEDFPERMPTRTREELAALINTARPDLEDEEAAAWFWTELFYCEWEDGEPDLLPWGFGGVYGGS